MVCLSVHSFWAFTATVLDTHAYVLMLKPVFCLLLSSSNFQIAPTIWPYERTNSYCGHRSCKRLISQRYFRIWGACLQTLAAPRYRDRFSKGAHSFRLHSWLPRKEHRVFFFENLSLQVRDGIEDIRASLQNSDSDWICFSGVFGFWASFFFCWLLAAAVFSVIVAVGAIDRLFIVEYVWQYVTYVE